MCLADLMVMPTKINSLSITEDCAAIYMANTTHVDCGAFDAKNMSKNARFLEEAKSDVLNSSQLQLRRTTKSQLHLNIRSRSKS